MAVQLREEAMWPLTSPTTLYSGAQSMLPMPVEEEKENGDNVDGACTSFSTSLATAFHTIRVTGLRPTNQSKSTGTTRRRKWDASPSTAPHIQGWEAANPSYHSTERICVGYAANTHHQVVALLSAETLEGFWHEEDATALDPDTALQLREAVYSTANSANNTNNTEGDTASVTTATAASVLSEASVLPPGPRRTSSMDSSIDHFSTTGGDAATTAETSQIPPLATASQKTASTPVMEGLLAWKTVADDSRSVVRTSTLAIDFRPFAMTLGHLYVWQSSHSSAVQDGGVSDERTGRPVVWMGSADSNRLYAFLWTAESATLQPLPLEHEAFEFDSPVMAIDLRNATSSAETSYLAVACQDGTVRFIRFGCYDQDKKTWADVQESTVIVDGPLVCIHLVPGTTDALVGSLCGYVMLQDKDGTPFLVTAGLEVEEGAEDSVLAVHGFDDWVAIGTQAGSLLLYRRRLDRSAYDRMGQWQLPYSVHEICGIPGGNELLVTTRKSLHLFSLRLPPVLDPSLARLRLDRLLKRVAMQDTEGTDDLLVVSSAETAEALAGGAS